MRLPVLLLCTAVLAGCSVDMGGFAFQSETRGGVTTTRTTSASAVEMPSPANSRQRLAAVSDHSR